MTGVLIAMNVVRAAALSDAGKQAIEGAYNSKVGSIAVFKIHVVGELPLIESAEMRILASRLIESREAKSEATLWG